MARKSNKTTLSDLELKIMQIIWRRGPSNVADVQSELDPPLAYTTVQTVMNILERKGKLSRRLQGRAFLYSAKITEDRALRQGVRELIDRMFGGSSEELVMSLLKNRQIDPQTLAALTRRFNSKQEEEE
ncbi:MAG TPA: BlaI/MecI/CopY family transcriptional regulator [Acidobacteriaceae bacterium]|nr:BlaI/MecI/CopY family transcriptional regulator [Acidobacteriaceae bacterium]